MARMREAAGLTQAALAGIVGVHPNTVSKWESDSQGLHGENLTAVAGALGVTVEELSGAQSESGVSRATPDDWTLMRDLAVATPEERRQLAFLWEALKVALRKK